MLCQLSYAPRFEGRLYPGRCVIISGVGGIGMAALFSVLTLAFGGIAVGAGSAGRWVIAIAAAALAAWMGSFALTAVRRTFR